VVWNGDGAMGAKTVGYKKLSVASNEGAVLLGGEKV